MMQVLGSLILVLSGALLVASFFFVHLGAMVLG